MCGSTEATYQASDEPTVPSPTPLPTPSPVAPTATIVASKPTQAEPQPSVVDDEQLRTTVVEVVVIHTGYPADFIELDQDLEGELGIDTVKQAEIMADIRDRFGLPLDEDFILSDYPTLNHMIGYIQRMQGTSVEPSNAPPSPVPEATPVPKPVVDEAPQPVAEAPPVALPSNPSSDASVDTKLVEIVVKHTGYPADFIEMDQDLEGELGIDTVKQAEIMGDVREIFALPLDEDFVLSDHPTLNHFTSYILRMKGGSAPAPPAAMEPEVVPVILEGAVSTSSKVESLSLIHI